MKTSHLIIFALVAFIAWKFLQKKQLDNAHSNANHVPGGNGIHAANGGPPVVFEQLYSPVMGNAVPYVQSGLRSGMQGANHASNGVTH